MEIGIISNSLFYKAKIISYYYFFYQRFLSFDTFQNYYKNRNGILTHTFPAAFLPTTKESEAMDWPEIQLTFTNTLIGKYSDTKKFLNIDNQHWDNYISPGMNGKDGITILYTLLRPKSRFVCCIL